MTIKNFVFKSLGVLTRFFVMKAEEGDTKMVFGNPMEYRSGKWVPTDGGGKEEAPTEETGKPKDEEFANLDYDKREAWIEGANDAELEEMIEVFGGSEIEEGEFDSMPIEEKQDYLRDLVNSYEEEYMSDESDEEETGGEIEYDSPDDFRQELIDNAEELFGQSPEEYAEYINEVDTDTLASEYANAFGMDAEQVKEQIESLGDTDEEVDAEEANREQMEANREQMVNGLLEIGYIEEEDLNELDTIDINDIYTDAVENGDLPPIKG